MRIQTQSRSRLLASVGSVANSRTFGNLFIGICRLIVIVGISYIVLHPLLTKLSASFMAEKDLFDITVGWIPRNFTLDNYANAWRGMEYPRALLNSISLTLSVGVLQLMSITLVGYGFARFNFIGKPVFFGLVLLTLVVPPTLITVPMYLNFRFFDFFGLASESALNLIGTHWPFTLPAATASGFRNGIFVYIMVQAFRGISSELEEAAYIDGAGTFTTFTRVMLPNAVPALVIVFLFSFVWQWNEYYYVSMFGGRWLLLPRSLDNLVHEYMQSIGQTGQNPLSGDYASLLQNAGSILLIAPPVLLYLFTQKYFIESVERSGLVG